MKQKYQVIIEWTGKNYSAHSPDLPGCIATGKSLEETSANMREAIIMQIDGLKSEQVEMSICNLTPKMKLWIDRIHYDLDSAEAVLKCERYLYVGLICFLAVEKTLILHIFKTEENHVPMYWTLTKLAEHSGIMEKMSQEQKAFIEKLDEINKNLEMPSEDDVVLKSLNKQSYVDIFHRTKSLVEWLMQQLR